MIKRHHIFILFASLLLFIITYLSLADRETTRSRLLYSKFQLTRWFNSYDRNLKSRYFNDEGKVGMAPTVIRNMLEDEYDKFKPERQVLLDDELKNLTGETTQPLTINFTHNSQSRFQDFMNKYIGTLNDNRMLFPHPERITKNEGKPVIWDTLFLDKSFDLLSQNMLANEMKFSTEFIKDLRLKHKRVVGSLPKGSPTGLYHGNGYVMIGGGIYTWLAFLSIQALRKSGSKLPLELILPSEKDWEPSLCNKVLPHEYNARCLTFSGIFGDDLLSKFGKIKGYQYKVFALLGSSFENTFYLDSDNFAVRNPDYIFKSRLYKRYQMITWPDFWRRTSSPSLYSVLGIKLGGKPIRHLNDVFTPVDITVSKDDLLDPENRINFHDRKGTLMDWSTESGEILMNKTSHFNTLLLSLYYNYDGPAGYHPLLSQGGAGEGDKETYVLAAYYLKKPYYQVYRKPTKLYGTFIKEANWHVDSTIVQMDPVVDYENVKRIIQANRNLLDSKTSFVYNYDYAYGTHASADGLSYTPMFYHIHSPKMNPFEYVSDDLFTDMEFEQIRNFGDDYYNIGFDLELWIWQTVKDDLCNSDNRYHFACFTNNNMSLICNNSVVDDRIEWLSRTGREILGDDAEQSIKFSSSETGPDDIDDWIYDRLTKSLDYEYEDN